MIQVGARHNEGAFGLRHLGAIDGNKTVRPHIGRLAELGAFEHRRPEQAVEVDNILADKVVDLGFAVFLPVIVKVDVVLRTIGFKATHVADWRVQPYIEVFARRVGYFKAKVRRVAADVPLLQALFEPFVELVGHLVLQRT